MNYSEALQYIHTRGKFTHPAGLERMCCLNSALGDPQKKLPVIHIAGTNGKGSTAAFCASVFRAAGLKTGLYISPFVLDFRERIQINGAYIPENELARLTETVCKTGIHVNEFELITAIAFLYFAQEKCDVVVLETGLGGRLDATNTATDVRVSVLTKIGLDHTAILGDTLEQIAEEKCGILKNDVTVTSPNQPPAALQIIRQRAKKLIVLDLSALSVQKCTLLGNAFTYKGVAYETTLGGEYQIENALTAIETVLASGFDITTENLQKGLLSAAFPARLEVLSRSPLLVLDGAHNPDGATVLAHALEDLGQPVTAIIGMMRDKNVSAFLQIVLPFCERVICVPACDLPRTMPAEELAAIAAEMHPNVQTAESVEQALSMTDDRPTFIFGSLYLAAEVKKLEKRPKLLFSDN
ncbi:MAG: bifunctional folylpolyglutamate synthase/dihydrofolate synthase [Clostridia bacterium]|nr:bifunctional folylpolyglutamate synthase/dihydrofolate synthase [Clostridia bacterium]